MSLHALANHMAAQGRGPDSVLVHMTPNEVHGLQRLAMAHGGSLTINPDTGLPEAGFLSKILPAVAGFALNAFAPGVGTAVGSLFGVGAAAGTGIAIGGATALATGDLSKGLMAGMGAYGGAGLGEGLLNAGTSAGLNDALASAGTAEGAQGEAFNKFLTSDANPAVGSMSDKYAAGWDAMKADPMGFAKNNFKPLVAAAAPVIADQMVPTTVKAPPINPGYIRPYDFNPQTMGLTRLNPVKAGFNQGGIVALAEGGQPPEDPFAGSTLNTQRYLAQNPDVAQAYLKDPQAQNPNSFVTQHYNIFGAKEGRASPAALNPFYNMTGDSAQSYNYLMGYGAKTPSATQGTGPTVPVVTTKPTVAPTKGPGGSVVTEPTEYTWPTDFATIESDFTDPTDATDPTNSSVPTDASDPTDYTPWTDPTEPSVPTEPTDYTEFTEATVATEPTDPTDYSWITDPTDGTVPTDATDATDATDPTEFTEWTWPTDFTVATDPTGPTDATDVTDATVITDPTEWTWPTDATDATDVTDATVVTDPTEYTWPTDGTDFTEATGVTDPTGPTDSTGVTDATDATDGTGVTDFTDPTDYTWPTDVTDFTDATGVTDSTDFTDSTDSTATTDPTEWTWNTEGSEGTGGTDPTESTTTTEFSEGSDWSEWSDGSAGTGITDNTDFTDATDSTDYTGFTDSTDFTFSTDATDFTGFTDSTDFTFSTDATDFTGFTDSTDFTFSTDATDYTGFTDSTDFTDATDGSTGDTFATDASLDDMSSSELLEASIANEVSQNAADIAQELGIDQTIVEAAIGSVVGTGSTDSTTEYTDLGNGLFAVDNDDGTQSIFTDDGSYMGSTGGNNPEEWEGNKTPTGIPNVTVQGGSEEIGNVNDLFYYPDTLEQQQQLDDFYRSQDTGGFNDGGYCPAPWINILLADGGTVKAGNIKPGMEVYTRHETTNEWGVYPVSAVEMSEDERWEVLLEDGRSFVGSPNHRVHTGEDWTEIHALKAGDKLVQPEGFGVVKSSAKFDHGPVVKITVTGAHTYISEGFLSHNVKMMGLGGFGGGGGYGGMLDDDSWDFMSAARGGLMDARYAAGGMPMYAGGGLSDLQSNLGGYSDGGRLLRGPGDGVSDSIPATIGKHKQPARLADGEFVIPARIVSELGNGSTEAGSRKLYAMMDRIQKSRGKTVGKGKVATNSRADKHLPA